MRRGLGRAARGLTLIELAVAILVLALGTVAAIRVTDQARVSIRGEVPRVLVRIAARNRAETLLLQGATGPALLGVETLGTLDIALGTRTEITAEGLVRATITARAPSGEAAQAVVFLSGLPR
ncbi:prepilin-type N-terminal cleavage/methylation domain-containing protein [Citreimonas sp.]|uniref:prepilin-type N-terminal cleavage/methylation domain-containing protein n=1 Tax=Citreimonas sp. TaxID=3036715 RepID=UPI0035C842F4